METDDTLTYSRNDESKFAHAIHVTIAAGQLVMNESPLWITKRQTNELVHASIKSPDKIIGIQCRVKTLRRK
jgi:hypothetical protein